MCNDLFFYNFLAKGCRKAEKAHKMPVMHGMRDRLYQPSFLKISGANRKNSKTNTMAAAVAFP